MLSLILNSISYINSPSKVSISEILALNCNQNKNLIYIELY